MEMEAKQTLDEERTLKMAAIEKPTSTLRDIENLGADYAGAIEDLGHTVAALDSAIRTIKAKSLPGVKRAAAKAAAAKARLKERVEASALLFGKPRTRIFHGVKVGFAKNKGSIEWRDEDAVIRRIKKLLPEDQVELLIRSKENVHKPAVYDLSASDLKRLGIEITGAGDQVVIKLMGSDIEKLVDAMLEDGDREPAGG